MKTLLRLVSLFAVLTIVSGCATQPPRLVNEYAANLAESELYLRGTFNWWGVNEAFRFLPGEANNTWYADISLIDDGTPYDFRVSNSNWTPSQSCGAKSNKSELKLNASIPLFCDSNSKNLVFKPSGDGQYRIQINKQSNNVYQLAIKKL